ncbi:hypothetical protein N7490_008276 [Penicillium lividum]|nr:hypothetical protein N7490_008276 [Penicillium lividum]
MPMPSPYWKDRFNEKQLERKRLSDKISQRRARQQSKRSKADLEQRLRLLLDGETGRLINCVQQENALLRMKILRYRSQMERMFIQGKECLLQDDSSWNELNTSIITQPSVQPELDMHNPPPLVDSPSDSGYSSDHPAERRCKANIFKNESSLFVELAGFIGRTNITHSPLEVNEILESIMMWKAKFGLVPNEFIVVLTSLNLNQEPFYLTPEKVAEQAWSKYLFQDIIQNLLYGEEPCPRNLQPEDKIPEEQMSKMQYQRQAVAYCAYETVRAWRECFKSSLEYTAVFWAQYRYFMHIIEHAAAYFAQIIAFPTLENFHKCPAWRHPIAEQFKHGHPSIVDLLVWPKLREKLVSTWHQYDLPGLCVSIVRSLEFRGVQTDIATVVKLELDSSDVLLEEAFTRDVHDIRNFIAISAPFTTRYPELAATITEELILHPSLSDPQEDRFPRESFETFDDQMLMSEFTLHGVVFQPSPSEASELQSGPIPSSNSVNSMDPLHLVANFSTAIPGSPDWWTESLTDQGFQAFSLESAETWDPKSSAPDLLPFSTMIEIENMCMTYKPTS